MSQYLVAGSYVGKDITAGEYKQLDDISGSFNGQNTTFTLTAGTNSISIGSSANLILSISGVYQHSADFSVTAPDKITFTTAPEADDTFDCKLLGDSRTIGVPTSGTVGVEHLSDTFHVVNKTTYTDFTVPSGKNAMIVGEVSITGTLLVPNGSTLVIL